MKKLFLITLLASLTFDAFADVSTIIRQKARDSANTHPTGEGAPPKPGQANPANPPAKPAQPAPLPPDQQALVNELAIAKTNDTQKLRANLTALAYGTQKPSPATIEKLANDLANAMIGHPLPPAQRARIAQDIQTVFSAGNLTAAKAETFIIDVPMVLKAAGVEAKWTAAVADDLRAARKEVIAVPAAPK